MAPIEIIVGAGIVLILVLTSICLMLWASLRHETADKRQANESLEWYRTTYCRRQGWTIGWGNYELMSFDRGRNWFEMNRLKDGGLIVVGPADPKLVQQLEGMSALVKHAWQHGPLDLSHPSHLGLLQAAGFTVQSRD